MISLDRFTSLSASSSDKSERVQESSEKKSELFIENPSFLQRPQTNPKYKP